MNRKRNFRRVALLLVMVFFISAMIVQAQPPAPPSGHGFNGNQGAGGAAPVDGGIGILLLSAVGYGLSKLRRGSGKRRL
jgi:hypothetical protein